MRQLCTLEELRQRGVGRIAREKGWRRSGQGVYVEGTTPPSRLDRALAVVVVTGGIASGRLAGVLLGLDGVSLRGADVTVRPGSSNRRAGVRRRELPANAVVLVAGFRCTSGLQTLIDLAAELDDVRWEQALESALRKKLVSVAELERCRSRRIRRVLALRPKGARPTESLLETLLVQRARRAALPDPKRQVDVFDADGNFVARVDLAWPDLGLFVELDGQQHQGQPVYDARRETAVVAATGWLCGRFTWKEVVDLPATTARRLAGLLAQARLRPMAG
jgi:very-short-patch-repair endonuclease